MFRRILLGAAAGAAGTTALNAVTYLDMALTARPASGTPEETVEKIAGSRNLTIPGAGEARANRLTALGALSGIATGVAVGAGFGLLDVLHVRPPGPLGALVAGAGAMALANATMTAYGVTDPSTWSAKDWGSDVVPHLAYGAVVSATYSAATR
jgi:hypothetical protein